LTVFYYIAQATLESSCLSLPSAGIAGVHLIHCANFQKFCHLLLLLWFRI
jgi:hypothetical protein